MTHFSRFLFLIQSLLPQAPSGITRGVYIAIPEPTAADSAQTTTDWLMTQLAMASQRQPASHPASVLHNKALNKRPLSLEQGQREPLIPTALKPHHGQSCPLSRFSNCLFPMYFPGSPVAGTSQALSSLLAVGERERGLGLERFAAVAD